MSLKLFHKNVFFNEMAFFDLLTIFIYDILYTVGKSVTIASIIALYFKKRPKYDRLTADTKFGKFTPFCGGKYVDSRIYFSLEKNVSNELSALP